MIFVSRLACGTLIFVNRSRIVYWIIIYMYVYVYKSQHDLGISNYFIDKSHLLSVLINILRYQLNMYTYSPKDSYKIHILQIDHEEIVYYNSSKQCLSTNSHIAQNTRIKASHMTPDVVTEISSQTRSRDEIQGQRTKKLNLFKSDFITCKAVGRISLSFGYTNYPFT